MRVRGEEEEVDSEGDTPEATVVGEERRSRRQRQLEPEVQYRSTPSRIPDGEDDQGNTAPKGELSAIEGSPEGLRTAAIGEVLPSGEAGPSGVGRTHVPGREHGGRPIGRGQNPDEPWARKEEEMDRVLPAERSPQVGGRQSKGGGGAE